MSMRLKDKQTGEVDEYYLSNDPGYGVINASTGRFIGFDTLAELNEMFEDAPKEMKTWEEVVQIKELPSGLKIADRDYYEVLPDGTKKTKFTGDETMEIEKKINGKWRVPSSKELNQIAIDLGYNDEGNFDGKLLADNLGTREELDINRYINYRSCTLTSDGYFRHLNFGLTYLSPTYYNEECDKFSVRCVAGEK